MFAVYYNNLYKFKSYLLKKIIRNQHIGFSENITNLRVVNDLLI